MRLGRPRDKAEGVRGPDLLLMLIYSGYIR